jgi:hypothetical protein
MKLLNILYEHIGESDAFIKSIQSLINHTLSNLKEEIEDMGLGEMDMIREIDSIEGIRLVDYEKVNHTVSGLENNVVNFILYLVYDVNLHNLTYNDVDYYDMTTDTLMGEINKIIPGTTLSVEIKDGGEPVLTEGSDEYKNRIRNALNSLVTPKPEYNKAMTRLFNTLGNTILQKKSTETEDYVFDVEVFHDVTTDEWFLNIRTDRPFPNRFTYNDTYVPYDIYGTRTVSDFDYSVFLQEMRDVVRLAGLPDDRRGLTMNISTLIK